MAILQVGDKYEVVWNGIEFILVHVDSTSIPASTIVHYGLDPTAPAPTPGDGPYPIFSSIGINDKILNGLIIRG